MLLVLVGVIALVTVGWAYQLMAPGYPDAGSTVWAVYLESLFLSGLLSVALMSMVMVLATRPAWLEKPLGGMDKIYRLHKWGGILAVLFAAAHWLLEMSEDLFENLAGRSARLDADEFSAFPGGLRDLGEDLGEFVIYLMFAMLLLSLWRQFSYRLWRPLHRAMPALYLLVVFHAVVLAPAGYWQGPLGWLMAVLFVAGSVASVWSLTGRIGAGRSSEGTVISVERVSRDILEVTCKLADTWRGHRAGQFAFVIFDRFEGHHPFTIASADRGDKTVTFAIKALGDYTQKLSGRLVAGDPVKVEGPYGRFQLDRARAGVRQIWVAGGIGITPFLAWLESLDSRGEDEVRADIHYCVTDPGHDPFVARLESLCAARPGVDLHLHGGASGRLTAEALAADAARGERAEVWFCGPQGMADSLRKGLRRLWPGRVRFHQEAFRMR